MKSCFVRGRQKIFYVVFCVFRDVQNFDCTRRLVTNEITNKRRQRKEGHAVTRDSCFWQDLFLPIIGRRECYGILSTFVQVNCFLWSKGLYGTNIVGG